MRRALAIFFVFISFQVSGQGVLDWWDQLHNYPDAAGPDRSRYINLSPGYLGPNAMIMPSLPNMTIDNEFWVQALGQTHAGNGDKTQNFFLKGNFPLARDRVMLYITSVPYETWEVTPETRDERRMMGLGGKGGNTGDVAYGVIFKVFREKHWLPFNFGFRLHTKTTTGGNLTNARSTDNSLYQWEGNFSKTMIEKEEEKLLLKASLGFVTWQTNKNRLPGGSNHNQNDAPYYGFGVEYLNRSWLLSSDVVGYTGYLGNRDYPHFFRTQVQYRFNRLALRTEYNYGLQSWDWNTFSLGVRYYILELLD
ncbi:hypothetical protein AWW68_08665 [Roseivirga spongicola]|uniref:Uncharacterized protein n=1 Tax=Roseivirga spongicola TaxID=333140 RepID=A0A150XAY8_9BACT|nr:hypothetical protein [Roseivirga spongicola]KYG75891.1 hypothetical protein AWW68_08665 [Roseivirga spongicola]